METNYWATKKVCETLFPLLRDGARVVNVSSSAGFLGNLGLQTDDMMVDVSAHTGNEVPFHFVSMCQKDLKNGHRLTL